MKLTLTGYARSLDLPGGPVTWNVRIDEPGKVGTRNLAPQVVTLAETDAALMALNREIGGADNTWDEATLLEATKRTLELAEDQTIKVAVPPVMT